jgi:cell division protein FtsL
MEPEIPQKPIETPAPSRPMVYNGTMPAPLATPVSPGYIRPAQNRKVAVRKVSTFNLILMLFGIAAVTVLYISNIIAVDRLMMEINTLQKQHQKMVSDQEFLKAEINRLSSLERVNKKAADELGLINPKEPPVWITVDLGKIREIEQALRKK